MRLTAVTYYTLGLQRTIFLMLPVGEDGRVRVERNWLLDRHPFLDDEVDCYISV